jgi:segregation and condensation protein A
VPDDAYVVSLPMFEGPLDLLLSIIQKHELDILDIPVSFVTQKYLEYLDVMRSLTIDVASEYLVMAATLAHIKSRMLLPEPPKDQDGEGAEGEELDPRAELVRRLLEYQKYKNAAEALGSRDTLGSSVFARGGSEPEAEGPAPFAPVGTFDLLDAFAKVLARTKTRLDHEVVFDRISISDRITQLVDMLRVRRSMPFDELFSGGATRFDLVITFLAVLEMARLKMMRVFQAESLSPIHVELLLIDDEPVDPLKFPSDRPPGGGSDDDPR